MRCIFGIICAKMGDFECLKCRLCRLKRSVGVSCDGNALKSASSMLCFAVLIGIARQKRCIFEMICTENGWFWVYCLPFVQVKAVNPGYLWRNCVAKSVFYVVFCHFDRAFEARWGIFSEWFVRKTGGFECLVYHLCRLKQSVGVSCSGNALKRSCFTLYFVILIGIARQDEGYFRNDLHEKQMISSVLFAVCAG